MTIDVLSALSTRQGHFLLESGYHTDLWLTLDAVFVSPKQIAPLVQALAGKLHSHGIAAICGPLLGGAFLAQAIATTLGIGFYYTQPGPASPGPGLFKAEYRLPAELSRRVGGERVAVVDDVISAGSSVRATVAALAAAGASIAAVGALLVLGQAGLAHFAALRIPVETLGHRDFNLWQPADCPLCRGGVPLEVQTG